MIAVDTYINRNSAYSLMHQMPYADHKDKGNHKVKHRISELDRLCFNLEGQYREAFYSRKSNEINK